MHRRYGAQTYELAFESRKKANLFYAIQKCKKIIIPFLMAMY